MIDKQLGRTVVWMACALSMGVTIAVVSYGAGRAAASKDSISMVEERSHIERMTDIDGFYTASFKILVKSYYGGDATVESVKYGPAGTIIGQVVINKEPRTAIMLPDARTIVLGEIRSVFLNDAPSSKVAPVSAPVVKATEKNDRVEAASAGLVDASANIAQPAVEPKPASTTIETPPSVPVTTTPKIEPPEGMKSAINPNKNAIYGAAGKAGGFVTYGEGKKLLYVFIDPNCPACREAIQFINTKVVGTGVEVRYLPLSILGPDSQDKASYILDVTDNAERQARFDALHSNHKKMGEIISGFSYKNAMKGDKAALINFALLKASGTVSTPRFMYMTQQGAMISAISNEKGLLEIINTIVEQK